MNSLSSFIPFLTLILFCSTAHANSSHHIKKVNGRYFLAATSGEVKEIIGVWKTAEDMEKLSFVILQRAKGICEYYGATLSSIKLEADDSKQRLNIINNGQIESIWQNDSFSPGRLAINAGTFLATGGIGLLVNGSRRQIVKALIIDAALMGGV